MISTLQRWGKTLLPGQKPADTARPFRELAKTLWPAAPRDRHKVVLVSLYQYPASVIANAYLANRIAERQGARVGYFTFDEHPEPRLRKLYESFGATRELGFTEKNAWLSQARLEAGGLLQNVQSKEDLLRLSYGGLFIGDLVYDAYLRLFCRATPDLSDPRLADLVAEAICQHRATTAYLAAHEVVAMIIDHHYYLTGGVIARLATQRNIPIIHYGFTDPGYVYRIPTITAHDGSAVPARHDSERFPAIFDTFPAARQEEARQAARSKLTERLSGGGDYLIYGSLSSFSAPRESKILPDNGKPRILVMLHEFCDAPNCLGPLLFPDFYEWTFYLLERAVKNPFEWIIKPHACLQTRDRSAMNLENERVVEEIRTRFPQLTILNPDDSNRQILDEGISALFTVRGSAAYEFAYAGVPVVAAGRSFYSSYPFVHQAKTLAELDDYIARAGHLDCPARSEDVESFYYMFRERMKDDFSLGRSFFPDATAHDPEWVKAVGREDYFPRFAEEWNPAYHEALLSSIDRAFARNLGV